MSLPAIDPSKLFDVSGKRALVVGATGSFGRVACATLGSAGAKLLITAGNGEKLAELKTELTNANVDAEAAQGRPDSEANCDKILNRAVEVYGGIDILVVASGMNDVSPIADMSPERFQKVMMANVEGYWLIARAVGRQLIEQGQGGKVVFTSSARGKLGHPAGYSAYCTSKSAVDGLIKSLGCEWGKYGITVNGIAPTVFRSPLTAWMFGDDEKGIQFRKSVLSRIPIGRLGEPEDLAGPLLFLCSAASDFHTGHILYADGGYTAG